MADTAITWGGLTIGGGGDYHVTGITGWDDLDQIDNALDQARVRGHGDHPGPLYSRARIVTVTGEIANRASRDALAAALIAASPVSSDVSDLTVQTFGQSLTAGARLLRRSLPVDEDYASGKIPFTLQWRCPDPRRYGVARSVSTGLPTSGGGLVYPLTYPLAYGAAGNPGQLTLANEGSCDASIVFDVAAGSTGGLPQGFQISAGGQRITYPTAVPPGQDITIDTDTGTVLAEGTADRRGELTSADWLIVPDGGSLIVQFTSLGGGDTDSLLTATWKPTSW